MTQTPGLSDDSLHVLDLLLAASESTELLDRTCQSPHIYIKPFAIPVEYIRIAMFETLNRELRQKNKRGEKKKKFTYPLLGKLPGPLVLSVPQQFNDTALIGSKTDNLAGNFADERGTARGLALGAADPVLGGVKRGRFLL